MAISVFCFRNGGKMPELSGFMKTYEDSSLYWIIREQAEPFFSAIVRINDGNGTDTEGRDRPVLTSPAPARDGYGQSCTRDA